MFHVFGIKNRKQKVTYQTWRDSLHPDDAEKAALELNAAIAGLKKFDTSFRVIWEDGSVHHIRAIAEVIRDEKGKAINVVGAKRTIYNFNYTNFDHTK